LIAGAAAFLAGSVLYMNPLVSGIYAQYSNYPCSKPMGLFGGLGNWLMLMLVGGMATAVFRHSALAGFQSASLLLHVVNVHLSEHSEYDRNR